MMEKFSVAWNGFDTSAGNSFRSLHRDSEFADVTLACDDDELFSAHKFVLIASSKFFRKIILRSQHSHPFLFLKGVKHLLLQNIMDFIYLGSVEVAQEDFQGFLNLAKDLQIMGLSDFKNESPKLNADKQHLEQEKEDKKYTELQEEDEEEDQYEQERTQNEISSAPDEDVSEEGSIQIIAMI